MYGSTSPPMPCSAPSVARIRCRSGSRRRISRTSCTATSSTSFSSRRSARAGPPDKIVDALQRHDAAFLKATTLRSWGSIDPGNAKLRELVGELIDEGLWRLLWMAAHAAVLAAGRTVRGQGTRDETAVVLGLEPGAGRRQRRPQLRSGTADDGRPARLLRQPRKAAGALAETDTDSGRRPIPSPTPPIVTAVPAAGRIGRIRSQRLPGRTAGGGCAARVDDLLSDPLAAEPAGGEHRRSVGMGRTARAGSGITGLPAGVARRRAGRGVGQRAAAAAESGSLRRVRQRSTRGQPAITRSAASGSRRSAHGPRPRLAGDSRGPQSERRERRR